VDIWSCDETLILLWRLLARQCEASGTPETGIGVIATDQISTLVWPVQPRYSDGALQRATLPLAARRQRCGVSGDLSLPKSVDYSMLARENGPIVKQPQILTENSSNFSLDYRGRDEYSELGSEG